MANNSELVSNIKTYVELDREIEALNAKTAELRKKRTMVLPVHADVLWREH